MTVCNFSYARRRYDVAATLNEIRVTDTVTIRPIGGYLDESDGQFIGGSILAIVLPAGIPIRLTYEEYAAIVAHTGRVP